MLWFQVLVLEEVWYVLNHPDEIFERHLFFKNAKHVIVIEKWKMGAFEKLAVNGDNTGERIPHDCKKIVAFVLTRKDVMRMNISEMIYLLR